MAKRTKKAEEIKEKAVVEEKAVAEESSAAERDPSMSGASETLPASEPENKALPEVSETPQAREIRLNTNYLETWRDIISLHCEAFLRRFPERCSRPSDTSWRLIETRQLARTATKDDIAFSSSAFPEYQSYYDSQQVRSLESILQQLAVKFVSLNEQRKEAKRLGVELAVERVADAFALSRQELLVLMVVAFCAMDSNIFRALALAWGNPEIQKPRVEFLCDMCGFSREKSYAYQELLSDRGQLVRMRLLIPEKEHTYSGIVPRMFSFMAIEQRVLDALRNADLSANLPAHTRLVEQALRPKALIVPKEFLRQLESLMSQPKMRILLTGPRHGGRCTSACSLARSVLHKRVVAIDVVKDFERLSEDKLEGHFCNILRESLLLNSVLLLRFDGLESSERVKNMLEAFTAPLSKHIEHFPGTIILTAKKGEHLLNEVFPELIECNLPLPTPAVQKKVWSDVLMDIFDSKDVQRLAAAYSTNYQLTVGQILSAVQHCLDAHAALSAEDAAITPTDILEEIRKCFSHDLGKLADIVLSETPIENVILPPETDKIIKEILNFSRYQRKVLDDWGYRKRSSYGNSLSILFAGPPGTGKTLLATAMANELGKILYRVDLSRVVDKYVGETEKNLAKIFDEAAKAQAILLFDEADSLFAKRTDVKSSNDRYANLEVNYLIQRLESYEGISILTTNLQTSIDEAFTRRLRYIVEFREPDKKERAKLWEKLIAPNTPLDSNVNWKILGDNFELSGGHIRNATLNASIRAASEDAPLGMHHLLEAAIAETQKLGKLVKLSDQVLLILDSYGVEID